MMKSNWKVQVAQITGKVGYEIIYTTSLKVNGEEKECVVAFSSPTKTITHEQKLMVAYAVRRLGDKMIKELEGIKND